MKKGIHPDYVECTVRCSCGNTFQTRSTKPEIKIDICSVCHPFYTGQQKFVDTGGRVQRFADKYGSAKDLVAEREAAKKAARAAKNAEAEAKRKAEREAKAAAKAERTRAYEAAAAEAAAAKKTDDAAVQEAEDVELTAGEVAAAEEATVAEEGAAAE